MNEYSDPLLRAVADGDPACPDGKALVALGQLVRAASRPPAPVDLVGRVAQRLAGTDDVDLVQRVDTFYEHGVDHDGEVRRLCDLVRTAARPQPVDLVARVRARIAGGSRRGVAVRADAGNRWQVWSAVVAGHVAALIAITVLETSTGAPDPGSDDITKVGIDGQTTGLPAPITQPEFLLRQAPGSSEPAAAPAPATWTDARSHHADLFALRRNADYRQRSRTAYGMEASAAPVAEALAWLCARLDDEGRFAATSGDPGRDLATQSLAVLALLGEGLDEDARLTAARRGLAWLAADRRIAEAAARGDQTPVGMAALALVEGSLLLDDQHLRDAARAALALTDDTAPSTGAASGFVLLALETARQGGIDVPRSAWRAARREIARVQPSDEDCGRIGLASFIRQTNGQRNAGADHLLSSLDACTPASDDTGRVDPLAWFFATLAEREAGGARWQAWAGALESALLPCFQHVSGTAWIPADRLRSGDADDVIATSLAVLDLQVPYRYLPLAHQ